MTNCNWISNELYSRAFTYRLWRLLRQPWLGNLIMLTSKSLYRMQEKLFLTPVSIACGFTIEWVFGDGMQSANIRFSITWMLLQGALFGIRVYFIQRKEWKGWTNIYEMFQFIFLEGSFYEWLNIVFSFLTIQKYTLKIFNM